MVTILIIIGMVWMCAAIAMACVFVIGRRIGNVGIVDAAWSLGVGIAALGYGLALGGDPVSRIALTVFACVWSLRLGLHILFDRVVGKPEDGRYSELMEGWGDQASSRLFRFFQYQAIFIVVFSLPFLPLALAPIRPAPWQLALAALTWIVAVLGEALADRQLARWRNNPANRGRTCRAGLWQYSRHPNYFFEWLHWWTYVVLGITLPFGWITLLGPMLMLFFLYRVTGIPYTEKQALKSRGDDYRNYQQQVSAFFPWFTSVKR